MARLHFAINFFLLLRRVNGANGRKIVNKSIYSALMSRLTDFDDDINTIVYCA